MRRKKALLGRFILLWALCLSGTGFGASVATLPESESFQSGELPHYYTINSGPPFYALLPVYTPWSFTTNGTARTAIAYDETDSSTQLIPQSTPSQNGTAQNYSRGQFYACTSSGALVSAGIDLNRSLSANVTFFVYESAVSNGTYTLIYSDTVGVAAGNKVVQSSGGNIPMQEGMFYLIGAGWDSNCQYLYDSTGEHPNTFPLGYTLGGYANNTTSTPPSSVAGTYSATAYQQTLIFSTNAVVRMDSAVNGVLSTNSMDLAVDLAGYIDVTLTFRHRAEGEDLHLGDGIFLSVNNGTSFVKIHTLGDGTFGWTSEILDIYALAYSAELTLTADTIIRFQQVDNYGWDSDGREFDDIKLYSKPDLEAINLTSGGSSARTMLWKGFDEVKEVPMVFRVVSRGGGVDYSNPSVRFSYWLRDSGSTSQEYEYDMLAWSIDAMLGYRSDSLSHTLTIPASEHLSDLNYTVRGFTDALGTVDEALENNQTTILNLTINHYSGWLWFDDVKADITISDWGTRVVDSASEHWISGTGLLEGESFSVTNLMVDKNLTTLDYHLDSAEVTKTMVPFTNRYEVAGVSYWRDGDIELSKNGAYGDIKVLLPAGLGISSGVGMVMNPTFTFGNRKLTQGLYPTGVPFKGGTFLLTEETKPVVFTVSSIDWNPLTGRFTFIKDDVTFVREEFLASLEAYADLMTNSGMEEKPSNAGYYRGVDQLLEDVFVYVGANGEAQLDAVLGLASVQVIAHFPYGVRQEWGFSGSELVLKRDLVDTTASVLKNPVNFVVSYARDCNGNLNCAGNKGDTSVFCQVAGHTVISPEGGFRTPVSLPDGLELEWGTRSNGDYTQRTTAFGEGAFYVAGHFVRGDQSAFDVTQNRGPAEILLSGMPTNQVWEMERPSQANYADGLADYAGLNLRTKGDDDLGAYSIIGGTETPGYGLSGRSKYYIRPSGVSGIHEASHFEEAMQIYEYPFEFSNLGLSYLSGQPQESRINGNVSVPEPCEINMDFEELMLDCLGELDEAELVESGTKNLVYWDADIQPLTLFFAPTASSSCGNAGRKLCMGLTTHCANVDQLLSGALGFLPTGELGAPIDEIEGVPSRLSSPNQIELDGPGNEVYYFNPVANPYYNDYSDAGSVITNRGWINFAGNVDVAFFEDLKVHFQTSASTNSSVAKIYMMGGWPEGGKTFFTTDDPDGFDLQNSGFPLGLLLYDEYRVSTNEIYQVHAQRSWLDVVNLDYPLAWSTATKSFKSPSTLAHNLLVVQVQHQTDYLSADQVEISFGVQYDGVPQINLANMAFNAVNEATGMASAFTDAVGEEIHAAVEYGMAAMDDTLSDLPEMLFDPVFDVVLDPVIDGFYTELYTAYTNAPTTADLGSIVTNYIHGAGDPVYGNVGTIISNLADTADGVTNLLDQIDGNLEEAVQLINAFASTVTATNGVSLPAGSEVQGLLTQLGGDEDLLAQLGIEILSVLAAPLYDAVSATIQEEMTKILESVEPSLSSITEVLLELRDVIETVQAELDSAGTVAAEISATLHSPLLQDPINEISNEIMLHINSMSQGDSSFDEYSPAEVKAMLRMQMTDAFYGSVPCADIQQVIRSQLYEVESMIQESIDSVFQQLNTAMMDLVRDYLTQLDEEINGALGDLSDIMGAGQLDGYAHFCHDALKEIRIDGKFQWQVPDEIDFNAHLIIKDLNSTMSNGCGVAAESLPEVTLGTTDFELGLLGSDIHANISTKFAFAQNGSTVRLIGMGGSFDMTEGEISFEAFKIDEFYAAVAFGAMENYLSANVHCTFTSYEVEGGIFLGRTCTLDPFSWDEDVKDVLGEPDPTFTGIYVYGEGWMPIVDYGCMFRIKAGVGAGIFAFEEGLIGGKIFLGAEGEALCVVNVSGDVTLVGVKQGNEMRMSGKGKVSGRAGSCPFCVKFSKTVTVDYNNGEWDVDY